MSSSPIAVEGVPFIAPGIAITVILVILSSHAPYYWILTTLALILTLFTIYFFRNPDRTPPEIEGVVVAPADGEVIYSGPAMEEFLGQEMQKISIFMSIFNVHVNRVPVSGRVASTFYRPGRFYDVRDDRATFENEQRGLVIETAGGNKLVVVQIAGLIARRIVCYAGDRDQLELGQRYGLIRFGSRLDVYLPAGAEVKVGLGDKTCAGETVLGRLL
jgi:phosphatidylserine decarboxylase